MDCNHAICMTDPISGRLVNTEMKRFWVMEGDGCHDFTIYFESEENKSAYLAVAVERDEGSVRVNLENTVDEGIDQG